MMAGMMHVMNELHDCHPEVRAVFGEPRRMDAEEGACSTSFEARKSALLPSERERAHPGMTDDIDQITQRQRQ